MSKEKDLNTLKGQCHENSASGFFRELSFKPLNFSKIREGTSSKFTASVVDTGGKLSAIVAAINVNLRKDVTNGDVDPLVSV
jgi:hypothetical protein